VWKSPTGPDRRTYLALALLPWRSYQLEEVEEEFLEHLTGTADYDLQFTRLQDGLAQSPPQQPLSFASTAAEAVVTDAAPVVAVQRGSYLPLLKRSILTAVSPPYGLRLRFCCFAAASSATAR
jgi:hypothetical protein